MSALAGFIIAAITIALCLLLDQPKPKPKSEKDVLMEAIDKYVKKGDR
jgi:hypothetical protein